MRNYHYAKEGEVMYHTGLTKEQLAGLLGIGLEQVIGDALGRLGTNAWQTTQLIEQFLQTVICTHIYACLRTACPGC